MNYSKIDQWKVFLLDFDGTLVDSYSCLPSVYNHIAQCIGLTNPAEKFVERAIKYEDEQDALGNYNRKSWWPVLFREFQANLGEERLDELVQLYWGKRSKESRIREGTLKGLEWLRDRGATLIILAGSDGLPGEKRKRVVESGLSNFFEDFFTVNEDVRDRVEGVDLIMGKYSVSQNQITFIDDKPAPINEINENFKGIKTIRVKFEGILRLAWENEKCTPTYEVKNIGELREIITSK